MKWRNGVLDKYAFSVSFLCNPLLLVPSRSYGYVDSRMLEYGPRNSRFILDNIHTLHNMIFFTNSINYTVLRSVMARTMQPVPAVSVNCTDINEGRSKTCAAD